MTWAVKQKVGNATGKAILLMLANYADEDGECFPSQEKLAGECECSVATVQRWLKLFEDWGALGRVKQYGEGGYRRADRLTLRTDLHITKLPSTELGSTELPNSVSKLTPHKVVAEPIKEPSSLRSLSSQARGEAEFRSEVGAILDAELLDTVVASRKGKKGAVLNGNAGRLLVKALRRCPDPKAAAEEMALRGWTTVKPQWLEDDKRRGQPPPAKPRGVGGAMDDIGDWLNGQGTGDGNDEAPEGALLGISYRATQ